jgi:hypothetical protein
MRPSIHDPIHFLCRGVRPEEPGRIKRLVLDGTLRNLASGLNVRRLSDCRQEKPRGLSLRQLPLVNFSETMNDLVVMFGHALAQLLHAEHHVRVLVEHLPVEHSDLVGYVFH